MKKEDKNDDDSDEEMSREEILAQLKQTRHLDVSKRELTVKNLPPELLYTPFASPAV